MKVRLNKYIINVTILILSITLFACEESCDEPVSTSEETINGITVKWRSQISEKQKSVVRDILNSMVLVEGDYFVMGATPEQKNFARSNEFPNSYIRLSDYYICKYEVTDEQFNSIMEDSKSASSHYSSRISFEEWMRFIHILQDLTELNFSLPSEAQWEFAARGGKQSKGYIYPGSNDVEEIRSSSFIVGSNVPNELGIYNMADLKSEWCVDFYNALVPGNVLVDWIQKNGDYHIVRGGNFRCTKEIDKYSNPSNNSSVNYRFGFESRYLDEEMDFRNCRITSRAYYYDSNPGIDAIGCRLVINIK